MVEGQLSHVLDGEDELESILAAKAALVTRLKAVINVSRHCRCCTWPNLYDYYLYFVLNRHISSANM